MYDEDHTLIEELQTFKQYLCYKKERAIYKLRRLNASRERIKDSKILTLLSQFIFENCDRHNLIL